MRPWHDMIVAPPTVAATARTPGMTTGRTPMSRPIGATNLELNQNDDCALRDSGAASVAPLTKRGERWKLTSIVRNEHEIAETQVAPAPPNPERVAYYLKQAQRSLNPVRYITKDVPEFYRNAVMIAAAAA